MSINKKKKIAIKDVPKTVEEAKKYLKSIPECLKEAQDFAFKQTVLAILTLSGLTTETDFELSFKHFEEEAFDKLAEDFLKSIQSLHEELESSNMLDTENEADIITDYCKTLINKHKTGNDGGFPTA